MNKHKACGMSVPAGSPRGVGTVPSTGFTCSWLPSGAVIGLRLVAVTWAQSTDMLGNAASTSASLTY